MLAMPMPMPMKEMSLKGKGTSSNGAYTLSYACSHPFTTLGILQVFVVRRA